MFVPRSIVLAILIVVSAATGARADDPLAKPTSEEAREHLTRGNKLYNVRSFDEAVAEYKAGAVIEPAPVFDYNLGQCYRQLGKYEDAIWHYDRFLKRGQPQGELLAAVSAFVTQMRSELDKKAMTQQPTDPAPTPAVTQAPAVVSTTAHVPDVSSETRPEAWYSDGLGWGLAGAGAVGVAVAGGLFLNAASLSNDANANPNQLERNSLRDTASSRNLLGSVIGIGGAALLVTGVIKLAIHPTEMRSKTSWNVGVTSDAVLVFGEF